MTAQTLLGTAELVGVFEDGTPEWHEQRASGIGSSDIGVILGLSSWKSALTLYHEKRGTLEPEPETPEQRERFKYGHYMEPFIGELFQERHRDEFTVHSAAGSWRSTKWEKQLSNPDALLGPEDPDADPDGILEKKTAPSKSDWDMYGVPPLYEAQVRWQMDTFGFRYAYIACWFAVGGYGEYYFEADDFIADVNRDAAMEFWRCKEAGIEPEIDGSLSTYTTLRRLNPSITPKLEVTVPEFIGQQYLDACAALSAAEAEELRAKGHLLAHAGTAQYILHQGQKIARRQAKGAGVPYIVKA